MPNRVIEDVNARRAGALLGQFLHRRIVEALHARVVEKVDRRQRAVYEFEAVHIERWPLRPLPGIEDRHLVLGRAAPDVPSRRFGRGDFVVVLVALVGGVGQRGADGVLFEGEGWFGHQPFSCCRVGSQL